MAGKAKSLTLGIVMTIGFLIVLGTMFMHLYEGKEGEKVNAFTYSDNLFNSMAKGSTDYFPGLLAKAAKAEGKAFEMTVTFHDGAVEGHEEYEAVATEVAANAARILGGMADVQVSGAELRLSGDLGRIMTAALQDAQAMFNNDGKTVAERYGMDERLVLFTWWKTLRGMQNEFKLAKKAGNSDLVKGVITKGVEVGYNFYGIAPEQVSTKAGILTFALIFYVIYTLWWGVAIMEIFTGLGLKMTRGAKKEV